MQEKINSVDKYYNGSVITCKTPINLIVNILKKNYIPTTLYEEFDMNFYYDLHVEDFHFNFKSLLKTILKILSILSFPLNGKEILKKLHISKS